MLEARVEEYDSREEYRNGEVNKILDALRSKGYEPLLRLEDLKIIPGGKPLDVWTPPEQTETPQ